MQVPASQPSNDGGSAPSLSAVELRGARLESLWRRRTRGELSAAERVELAELIAQEATLAAGPMPLGCGTPTLPLTKRTTRAKYPRPLKAYAAELGRSVRTLKTWIEAGRRATPLELPDFENKSTLAGWWTRCMSHEPPTDLLALASSTPPPGSPGAARSEGLDVDALLALDEGGALKDAKTFRLGVTKKLKDAYAAGDDTAIQRLGRRFADAAEIERRLEISLANSARQSGDLIPKAELFPELSQLLAVQRVMRSTMSRRIRASMLLPPDVDARVDQIIEEQRRGEEAVLRRLSQFQSLEQVERELLA